MLLSQKIFAAECIIKEAYEANNGNIFLSFSGGKDSTILRHIALNLYPDIPVVFSNTTNELTEVLKYVRSFHNVIHVKPKLSFSEVVNKYGFPAVSKEVSQKVSELKNTQGLITRNTRLNGDHKGNGILPFKWRFLAEQDFEVTHKCCKILKKDPLEKWAAEHGRIPVIALMADESALRKQLSLYGNNHSKIYPFLKTGWTEADIWSYATMFDIRFAECYYDQTINGVFLKARSRTGCEFCAFGIHLEKDDRFERSKLLAPKRFQKMMDLENNGIRFSEVIDLVKQNVLPKPELDLYGVKINDRIISKKDDVLLGKHFFVDPRHDPKKCPDCSSTKIQKIYSFRQSYFDAPAGKTVRTLWVTRDQFKCTVCSSVFMPSIPMINDTLNVSDRLIAFVDQVKDTYSFDQLIDETHLSFSHAVKIMRHIHSCITSSRS